MRASRGTTRAHHLGHCSGHSATKSLYDEMSATSCQQPIPSRPIPTKTLFIKDLSELPHCYSSTPGGTLFSTTPGDAIPHLATRRHQGSRGTRIIYDRKFLLDCRNSPIARTPPCYLPHIPGVTSSQHSSPSKLEDLKEQDEEEPEIPAEEDQFEMDI